MRIGEAAAAAGVTPDTLRFYEREGVVPAPPRTDNGYRAYTDDHLVSLRLAKALRDLDVPLREVREIVRVAHDGTCGDLRGALVEELDGALREIDVKITELERTREQVRALRNGLRRMRPQQRRVPGTTPCGCVRLLGADG